MQSHFRREHSSKIPKEITEDAKNQLFELVRTSKSSKIVIPRTIIGETQDSTLIPTIIQPTPLILSKNSAFTPVHPAIEQPIPIHQSTHTMILQKPPILTGQIVVRVQLRSVSVGPVHSQNL